MVVQEKITNIVIAGAGGQGNLFASRVLAQAAMQQGLEVKVAESYGVSQRGGSVHSQVRFGLGDFGPLIPAHHADVILGLEPLEALRHAIVPVQGKENVLPYPSRDALAGHFDAIRVRQVFLLDAIALAQEGGDARILNMIMVGALIGSGAVPLSLDEVDAAVQTLLPGEALPKKLGA